MRSKEVWRRIYDFPDYEVNSRGHVRRNGSSQKITPEKGLIDHKVKLWNKGDAKKLIVSELVDRYFPELKEGGKPIEWRPLVNFPTYEVTEYGGVRNRDTGFELPTNRTSSSEIQVNLWVNGVRGGYDVAKLVRDAFPAVAEAA